MGLGWSIMKPKILVWNVRGLNDKDKSLRIRQLLGDWRAYVYQRRNWSIFLGRKFVIYGIANVWIR